jgi:hypothetical protein
MSGMYVFGSVPRHNDERMPTPGSTPAHVSEEDAFDNELVEKPQPYFPAENADNADSADKQS